MSKRVAITVAGAEGRRPLATGSRSHHDLDTAEICSEPGDWVYQRQERDPFGTGVWGTQAKFCGTKLLGTRVDGFNGWSR